MGGLSKSEDIWGKRPFSSVFWISQVLFVPSGKGRKRQKKGEKGRFRPISRKGGQTSLKPPFVTPPFPPNFFPAECLPKSKKNSPMSFCRSAGRKIARDNRLPVQHRIVIPVATQMSLPSFIYRLFKPARCLVWCTKSIFEAKIALKVIFIFWG